MRYSFSSLKRAAIRRKIGLGGEARLLEIIGMASVAGGKWATVGLVSGRLLGTKAVKSAGPTAPNRSGKVHSLQHVLDTAYTAAAEAVDLTADPYRAEPFQRCF